MAERGFIISDPDYYLSDQIADGIVGSAERIAQGLTNIFFELFGLNSSSLK